MTANQKAKATTAEATRRERRQSEGGCTDSWPYSQIPSERAERDPRTGRALNGNQLARKYPKPPAPDDAAIAERLRVRVAQIVEDLGGPDRVGAVKLAAVERFTLLEIFAESWESYFTRSGLMTRQGRVRSGYTAGYLATVGQLLRLAQTIGLERVARHVPMSPRDWLEQPAARGEAMADTGSPRDVPEEVAE